MRNNLIERLGLTSGGTSSYGVGLPGWNASIMTRYLLLGWWFKAYSFAVEQVSAKCTGEEKIIKSLV